MSTKLKLIQDNLWYLDYYQLKLIVADCKHKIALFEEEEE